MMEVDVSSQPQAQNETDVEQGVFWYNKICEIGTNHLNLERVVHTEGTKKIILMKFDTFVDNFICAIMWNNDKMVTCKRLELFNPILGFH